MLWRETGGEVEEEEGVEGKQHWNGKEKELRKCGSEEERTT